MKSYRIVLNHPVTLIALKWGCEYPKSFNLGDEVVVDEHTHKELNDLGYVGQSKLIEEPTI